MMQRSPLALALALFAGIGLLTTASGAQPQATGDHKLAIGVVRIGDIMRNMAEMKKFDVDRRTRFTDLQQQQQQREMELQEMQKHRDTNDKQGSQQWIDDTNAIDDKAVKLESWKQISQIQLERWQKQRLKEMYDHVAAAAGQVAQQQQLDLVIADQTPEIGPDMDKVSPAKLEQALGERTVLFANKKADITEDVLTVVEANFAKGVASAGPAGPPPLPVPSRAAH